MEEGEAEQKEEEEEEGGGGGEEEEGVRKVPMGGTVHTGGLDGMSSRRCRRCRLDLPTSPPHSSLDHSQGETERQRENERENERCVWRERERV